MNKKILTLTLAASIFRMVFAAPDDKPEPDSINRYFKLLYQTVAICGSAKENPKFDGTGDYADKGNLKAECETLKKELDIASSNPEMRIILQDAMHNLDSKTFPKISLEASSLGFLKSSLSQVTTIAIVGITVPLIIGYTNNKAGAAENPL